MQQHDDWRCAVKVLWAILGCLSLCSCELSPGARDNALDDDYIPLHPQYGSGLADPRNYMDKDDVNVQQLIAPRYLQPGQSQWGYSPYGQGPWGFGPQ